MINGLKPYPAYKDSGVEWLGEVPEGWGVRPAKRHCRVFAGATPSRDEPAYWEDGTIPWLASGDVNRRVIRDATQFITPEGFAASSTKWIQPGSIVVALAGQGKTKGMAAAVEMPATCNQSLGVLEPDASRVDYRFLRYLFEAQYLYLRGLVGDGMRDKIVERIREDPYRLLVCADKFQTGYDEPLLHTMYVDKPLAGVQAVQTLSRLNRAHPAKHDAFVLDFANDADTIEAAFSDYYQTTILSQETDPDKLHDLRADLYAAGVFEEHHVRAVVDVFLSGGDRTQLDPPLDACVATYNEELDEDGQVAFKGNAKAFTRTYGFLASILPYSNPDWEELSIFCDFLIPKLPAPQEDDLSRGILETIDMDSYRAEKRETLRIALEDADAEIDPVPSGGGGFSPETEMERLSNIIKAFNDQFGNVDWDDRDRVERLITEQIPAAVARDPAYRNAMANSDPQNARIEHDQALQRAMQGVLKDDAQLYKLFSDNPSFSRWLAGTVFNETYKPGGPEPEQGELVTG